MTLGCSPQRAVSRPDIENETSATLPRFEQRAGAAAGLDMFLANVENANAAP